MYIHNHPSNSPFLYEAEGKFTATAFEAYNELLHTEIDWLVRVMQLRFPKAENGTFEFASDANWETLAPPDLRDGKGPYAALVNALELGAEERLLLILTLARQMSRHSLKLLTDILVSNPELQDETGCYFVMPNHSLVFTVNTVLSLIGGNHAGKRGVAFTTLVREGKLVHEQIIEFETPENYSIQFGEGEKAPVLAKEYVTFLLNGQPPRPDFGDNFPAKLVSTNLSWDHLVVQKATRNEVAWAMQWISHGKQFSERAGGKINTSFPILFYGPPGTGKSLTAKLIGKQFGKMVFRIDLSMMVSKYIGETEKNLARLFDRAQGKDWVLFFDEADSLFSKRTQVSDSHDKWANLETSYLLQRIEEYDGLCILATNLRDNIDAAMLRRFQYTIHFPRPTEELREQLWKTLLPEGYQFDELDFRKLRVQDLTGANIANVLNHACLAAEANGRTVLNNAEIVQFMALELMKESRTLKATEHIK
jgi:AAA+ superfamily predicted ATPase